MAKLGTHESLSEEHGSKRERAPAQDQLNTSPSATVRGTEKGIDPMRIQLDLWDEHPGRADPVTSGLAKRCNSQLLLSYFYTKRKKSRDKERRVRTDLSTNPDK